MSPCLLQWQLHRIKWKLPRTSAARYVRGFSFWPRIPQHHCFGGPPISVFCHLFKLSNTLAEYVCKGNGWFRPGGGGIATGADGGIGGGAVQPVTNNTQPTAISIETA